MTGFLETCGGVAELSHLLSIESAILESLLVKRDWMLLRELFPSFMRFLSFFTKEDLAFRVLKPTEDSEVFSTSSLLC